MLFSEVLAIGRWVVPLWLLGWLALPLSSRLMGQLPDRGLAAGRFLTLFLLTLLAFWGANLQWVALTWAPLLVWAFVAVGLGLWLSPWRPKWHLDIATRRHQKCHLFISDAVFLASFAFFLWVRLRYPEANNLEKPMDAALVSAAQWSPFLPFENPWYSGQAFTNYYYFGPLMSALLGRWLDTPPWLTYNLAQPAFCAFFLSMLWSLATALTRSWKWGLFVMALVGLGGHLEPLRQIFEGRKLWPLDWWTTSRVIPFTINEYPFFTLTIGDLHGHFYAFSLALLLFCLGWCICSAPTVNAARAATLAGGVVLGGCLLTNTWDAPCYALLLGLCVLGARRRLSAQRKNGTGLLRTFGGALLLAPLLGAPYFLQFQPQIKGGLLNSGFVFAPWLPQPMSLFLLWGSWLLLAMLSYGLLPILLRRQDSALQPEDNTSTKATQIFGRALLGAGSLALLFPLFFYIRGYMLDGSYRHMDTVFKFWLQAWLLLGLTIGVQCALSVSRWWPGAGRGARVWLGTSGAVLGVVLTLAPAAVLWTRTLRDASSSREGLGLGLNAMRYLPPGDQEAVQWLWRNAKPGESYLEAHVPGSNGDPVGDFDPMVGRLATFSGVPCYLGWPQHVMYWGAEWGQVVHRGHNIPGILGWPQGKTNEASLLAAKLSYIYIGEKERLRLDIGPGGSSILDQFEPAWGNPQLTEAPLGTPGWRPTLLRAQMRQMPAGP